MNNKKLYLVFGFMLAALVGLIGSFASAVQFKIDFLGATPVRPQYMRRNMTLIHYKDNWNNFGWFMYFANGVTSTWDVSDQIFKVQTSVSDAVECMQMVKWFYYNAERWERLRPLDPDTSATWWMSSYGLSLDGWLYTRCHGSGYDSRLRACAQSGSEQEIANCTRGVADEFIDSHGYYGRLIHNYKWLSFWLIVWTSYTDMSNKGVYPDTPLRPSFIRFDNKYPIGFVYDYNGGAWFVWCKILDPHKIKTVFTAYQNKQYDWSDLFKLNSGGTWVEAKGLLAWVLDCSSGGSAMNTLISVIVDGLVWITSAEKGESENSGIEWNQSDEKMQYFASVDINNTKLINYARQKAEILCRWKWKNSYSANNWLNSKVVCLSGNTTITSDKSKEIRDNGKTLIVKGWNVVVKNMPIIDDKNYDIFIDHGNLLIEDNGSDLIVFKKNWFKSDTVLTSGDFWDKVHAARDSESGIYTWDEVAVWKFIRWNFIVNGSVKANPPLTGLDNVYFIYWKFTTLDSVEDLKNTFRRRCSLWTGSDLSPCPISVGDWENPYEWASLVIIDQNYPSPLYN